MCAALTALALPLATARAVADVLHVGPGATYAEVADAIAAAQPGDAVIVAPGTYAPFVVDKAVRVLGAAGSGATTVEGPGAGVFVVGVPADGEAVVSGFRVRSNAALGPIAASIVVSGCPGTVVLHDILVDAPFPQSALVAQQSARIVLERFRAIREGPTTSSGSVGAVSAQSSALWIVDSTIEGGPSGAGGFAVYGNHAVSAQGGELRVWRSTLIGGDAIAGKGPFVIPQGGHGIRAIGSNVVLYGGPVGSVTGGDGAVGMIGLPGGGGSAVALSAGSSASAQASLVLAGGTGGRGAPAPATLVDAGSTIGFDPFAYPTLGVPPAPALLGTTVSIPIAGDPGAAAVLFAAARSGPTLVLPGVLGVTFLDPAFFIQVSSTTIGPAGDGVLLAPLPPLPALRGVVVHFQAFHVSGGGLAVTNPASIAIVR